MDQVVHESIRLNEDWFPTAFYTILEPNCLPIPCVSETSQNQRSAGWNGLLPNLLPKWELLLTANQVSHGSVQMSPKIL